MDVCVKVAVPAGAANGATDTDTVTATSVGSADVSASGDDRRRSRWRSTRCSSTTTTTGRTSRRSTRPRWTPTAITFSTWDLEADKNLPMNYTKSFKNIVWFTGNSYPAPITPYEADAEGLPRQRWPAVHVGSGHPRPGRRDDAVRPRLPAHHVGRHGDPERQGRPPTSTGSRAPGDGRRRHCSARPQCPRRCVRGSDHAERHSDGDLHRRHRSRPTRCRTAARTRSCSSRSRWRPTGPRRRRPT